MKYRTCDKCREIVAKTGFISSRSISTEKSGRYAQCNNKDCRKYFSKAEYEKLRETEL